MRKALFIKKYFLLVRISKYEDKYIVNLEKGEYHFDIETNGLTEDEIIKVVSEVLK